nr:hypothetical protein [Tanacetum cinerariifolium]
MNFTYECDFVVLEDTTSVIDHDLGSVVFEKLFIEATGIMYDMEEGTITFEKDIEKFVFKMPHKMDMFEHIDFMDIKTDRIPPFAIQSDDDNIKKTYYSNSLDLGPEYKHDENVYRTIRSLIAMKAKRNKEEFTIKPDGVTSLAMDTTSVIDHDLGSVVFEKLFIEATGIMYDMEEGTITFEKDIEKFVFKMPHKMDMFEHIDFMDIKTDRIPPFAIQSDDDNIKKTYYSNSLDLGPEYKHDENVYRTIRSLIAMKAKRNKEEFTLYLTRKSLEVLRKFHWTILGG